MGFYVGDIPSVDIVLEPARDGEAIDLAPFDPAETEFSLRDFDGAPVTADFAATFEDGLVVIEWPGTTVFETAGLFTLGVTLVGDVARERLAPVYFVAQDADSEWHTVDTAREAWDGAPPSDFRLFQILELARDQCTEYAAELADDDPIPANYREGQIMQARNLLNAGMVDPATGVEGSDTFVLRPHPLDWMVKQVLRPARAVPRVG